jgi:hypothetical protein
MRTKSLILMAVVGVAATASALAQNNVYSVNAVGYVNKPLRPGYTLLSNPLNTGSNTVTQVLPSVPLGTRLFRYANSSFSIVNYDLDDNNVAGWDNPNIVLAPGEGFFLQNPRSTNVTVTFVGEVPSGTLVNPLPAGFSLKASVVPQSGILDMSPTGLQFPATDGDRIYRWTGTTYQIANYTRDDNNVLGWDNPPVATPEVGEGFFIFTPGAKTWTRTFSATN